MNKTLLMLALALVSLLGGGSRIAGKPSSTDSFIEGVVVNSIGSSPEAGVWVIAETRNLPTPFRKIVVTNDDGRFVVPELPTGEYQLWVRGYGLKDSKPVAASIGKAVTLQVSSAANPQDAAKIYPANYWFSLWQPPSLEELPKQFKSRDEWIAGMKLGCDLCHQVGIKETRSHTTASEFDSAWRLAPVMDATANRLGRAALARTLADWGSRIEDGEVPPMPPR